MRAYFFAEAGTFDVALTHDLSITRETIFLLMMHYMG